LPPSDPSPPSRCHANKTRLASCVEEQGRHRATDRRPVRRGWARRSGFSRQGQRAPRESVQAIIFEPHRPIGPNGVTIHLGTGPPVPTSTVDHPTTPGLCPGARAERWSRLGPVVFLHFYEKLNSQRTQRSVTCGERRCAPLASLCSAARWSWRWPSSITDQPALNWRMSRYLAHTPCRREGSGSSCSRVSAEPGS
jgi:hypothetical protein